MVVKKLLCEKHKNDPKRIIVCVTVNLIEIYQSVLSAATVTRARIGCKRHQFIQNGPEHRVVTRGHGYSEGISVAG